MLEFAGKLGINPALLIAQIVNFVILLWILSRFLYKPIIDRIDHDEKELHAAKEEKERLQKERQEFKEQLEKQKTQLRKQVQEMVEEAEKIADKIKMKARQKARNEAEELRKQTKLEVHSRKNIIEQEIQSQFKSRFVLHLKQALNNLFAKDLTPAMQDVFYQALLTDLKSLPDTVEKRGNGPIFLEYTYTLNKKKKRDIKMLIREKCGNKTSITLKKNQQLICGFRLRLGGILVEENMFDLVYHAAEKL